MVFKTNILNTLVATSNLKVPQYADVTDLPNNSNQVGNVAYANGSFYGYNGRQWVSLVVGASNTFNPLVPVQLNQTTVFNDALTVPVTLNLPDPATLPQGTSVRLVNLLPSAITVQSSSANPTILYVDSGNTLTTSNSFTLGGTGTPNVNRGIELVVLPDPGIGENAWHSVSVF